MAEVAAELEASPLFARTFDRMPTAIEMVELDKIVVSQRQVTKTFVDALAARLSPPPDPEALFRFCQPLERRDPPMTVRRLVDRTATFSRPNSNDLRFHQAVLLRPEQIVGFESFGPIGAVVGLVVGFGSNFLSRRSAPTAGCVLHNGYHRAYALRAAGITHAPARDPDGDAPGRAERCRRRQTVVDEPAFYFAAKRPPLLKDFFDPRI